MLLFYLLKGLHEQGILMLFFIKQTIFIVSLSKAKNYFYSLQTIFVVFLNVLILSSMGGISKCLKKEIIKKSEVCTKTALLIVWRHFL